MQIIREDFDFFPVYVNQMLFSLFVFFSFYVFQSNPVNLHIVPIKLNVIARPVKVHCKLWPIYDCWTVNQIQDNQVNA